MYSFRHERQDKSIRSANTNGKVYINKGINKGFWSYAKEKLIKFEE
jgi:hypothetical protein